MLAAVATLYGQYVLRAWYIEDAAISFAYARNLGEGWGLVRYPGDERVEGYSNPLWVVMMAFWHAVGIDSFSSSKWMAAGLAPLGLLATFAAVRRETTAAVGVVAAAILATDATFVIWSASGLENALFAALLAVGLWRTLEEGEHGGFPWAAVAFLGLALTRPDGIAYAALGGIWALVLEASGPRRWKRIALWLAVFWAPFLVYHAVRYAYFAFLFPATAYAKLDRAPQWWRFNTYGWTYLKNYCVDTWRLWLLPVFLIGATGLTGWRRWAQLGLGLLWAIVLLAPGVDPLRPWWPALGLPTWWPTLQSGWIFTNALFLPLLAIRAPAWRIRMISWWMAMFGLWFAIASGGDWMRGYRWLSLVSVPLATLFALGLHDLYTLCTERLGRAGTPVGLTLGTALLLGTIAPQVLYQRDYRPETTPFSVDKRVKHYRWAMRMLDLEHVDIVDHDMGAMLYWGLDLGVVRDSKGLADIAFAYHRGEPRFVEEYAFQEYPFDLAHGHASTGMVMRRQGRRWRDGYIEFPGYGGNKPHQGNFFRKSLLVHPWQGSDAHRITFVGGMTLHGLEAPAGVMSARYGLALRYALSRTGRDAARLYVFFFDDDGVHGMYALPQGAEKFYPTEDWRTGEVVNERASMKPSPDLARGRYRVGLVLLGASGAYPPIETSPGVIVPETPLVVPGEVHLDDLEIEVVGRKRIETDAERALASALGLAEQDRCDEAFAQYWTARSLMARAYAFAESSREDARDPFAGCFARRAGGQETREAAVADMVRAMKWRKTHPDVLAVGPRISQPWYDEALEALEAGDNERAHALLVDVIRVDPSRSWARRHLEDLRKERLDLK